jgi:hypothetical protein
MIYLRLEVRNLKTLNPKPYLHVFTNIFVPKYP